MNTEFFEAVKILEKEKGVPAELLYEKIQTAIIVAVRKNYHDKDVVCCEIKPEESELNVFLHKTVVNEISDPDTDILTEEAQKYKPSALPGDIGAQAVWPNCRADGEARDPAGHPRSGARPGDAGIPEPPAGDHNR